MKTQEETKRYPILAGCCSTTDKNHFLIRHKCCDTILTALSLIAVWAIIGCLYLGIVGIEYAVSQLIYKDTHNMTTGCPFVGNCNNPVWCATETMGGCFGYGILWTLFSIVVFAAIILPTFIMMCLAIMSLLDYAYPQKSESNETELKEIDNDAVVNLDTATTQSDVALSSTD